MGPYTQKIINNTIVREFYPDVDEFELKWHQDLKDRVVTVIESGGWMFQRDDAIPVKLNSGDIIQINKGAWHRVIKGTGKLIVEIKEF